jgi:hypothetical protein
VLLSLLWVVAVTAYAINQYRIQNPPPRDLFAEAGIVPPGGHWVDEHGQQVTDPKILKQLNAFDWWPYALAAIGLPACIFMLGAGGFWVATGFRSH